MQAEVDSLHVEVSRRESNIELVNTEKERLINRLKTEEGVSLKQSLLKFWLGLV